MTPVLSNTRPEEISSMRVKAPLLRNGKPFHLLETPYLASVLVRASGLESESQYFCTVYYDDRSEFAQELFAGNQPATRDFLHKTGFVRVGSYGTRFSRTVKEDVYLEFGLRGRGRIEVCNAKLMHVGALEDIYTGKKIVVAGREYVLYVFEERRELS